ncbi:hypothetical protein PENDEC_c011G05563 [Penicillium decumbens]|uniref:Uncharacterized protein n=1 Tax=Penicillium decumbens TaxID=69771 RepID=A0A1V6PBB1_PENDC|nr:hypothetical protein PENDEC_c011G05563 [Penicillium decumbens]
MMTIRPKDEEEESSPKSPPNSLSNGRSKRRPTADVKGKTRITGPMSNIRKFGQGLERIEKSHRIALRKEKAKQEGIDEKLTELNLLNDTLRGFITNYEESIVEKEDRYYKAEAELRQVRERFDAAHRVGLARENYIAKMHHLYDGLNNAVALSKVEQDRRDQKTLRQIEQTEQRAAELNRFLTLAMEGLENIFNWHMEERGEQLEALKLIGEHAEGANEQLRQLSLFLDEAEKSARNLHMSSIYADEVNLAGGPTNTDRRIMMGDYPSSSQMMIGGPSNNIQVEANGNANMENASIWLNQEEVEVDADEDTVMLDAEAKGQVDMDQHQHQLRIERSNLPDLPDPDLPESDPAHSRSKRRARRLKWNTPSPPPEYISSPLPEWFHEKFLRLDIGESSPYLLEVPPLPPSKRIRLSRPHPRVWDSRKEDIAARELVKKRKGQPLTSGRLRKNDRPPPKMFAFVNATPNPEATINQEIQDMQGWTPALDDWSDGMMPGTYPEEDEDSQGGYIIIHYTQPWVSLVDWMIGVREAVLAKPEEYGMGIMGIAMMMWLAYYLSLYDEWMVANDIPLTSSRFMVNMRASEIRLVDKAMFSVIQWLDYDRTWTG